MNEFCIEWIKGKSVASITAPTNSWLAGKIRKLAEKSDAVAILSDTNEALFAHVPVNYISLRAPRQLSDEQKEKISERLASAREAKT